MSAYFAPLISLPVVIDDSGEYITRAGDRVHIERASPRNDFGCVGYYAACGTQDCWHRSGRLSASSESGNDIVRRA